MVDNATVAAKPATKNIASRAPALRERATKWNLFCNTADGALAITGFQLASATFVVPPFLRRAGASDTAIGLISAIVPLLTFLIPLVSAGHVQTLRRKKPFVIIVGLAQRVHLFAVAGAAMLLLPQHPAAFVTVYVLSQTLGSAATQTVWPAWSDLVAKVTPVTRRGALFAWRWSLGILPIALSGKVIHHVLTRWQFPANYALLFLAAGVCFGLSLVFIAFIRERGGKISAAPLGLRHSLQAVPQVLRGDRQFAWFIASQVLTSLAISMIGTFLALTAEDRFNMPLREVLARYMVINALAMLAGNLLFSRLGDRQGHKINMILKTPLFVAACVMAMLARDGGQFVWVFVPFGLATAASQISSIPITMEFGPEHERPKYMAIHATVFNPLALLGPLAGGLLRDYVGLTASFSVAIAMAAAGMTILLLLVPDPRRRQVAAH